MNIARCKYLPTLLLFSAFALFGNPIQTEAQTPPTPPTPPATYPQIVRLSLVQGDVRISRGKDAEHATGAVWRRPQPTSRWRTASTSSQVKAAPRSS